MAVFHILLALADGEKHGYGIMKEVSQRTEGSMKLGPGTLYGSIGRMLESGLIEASDERPDPEMDDERRRYYRLTSSGLRVAEAESRRLLQLLRISLNENDQILWSSVDIGTCILLASCELHNGSCIRMTV